MSNRPLSHLLRRKNDPLIMETKQRSNHISLVTASSDRIVVVDHLSYSLEGINDCRGELSFRLKPRERATIHNRLKRVNDFSVYFPGPSL